MDHGRLAPSLFSLGDVLDAMALAFPSDLVEVWRRELLDAPGAPGTFSLTDGMLLILAAASQEHAAKVVGVRPDLAEQVARVRIDPEAYLETVRREFEEQA